MPISESQGYCKTCGRKVMVSKETPNHLIHALVSLFLCGLWLPVWAFVCFCDLFEPWRCRVCGSEC